MLFRISSFLPLILLTLLCPVSSTCIHSTSLHRREAPLQKFGYTGPLGPINWAGISPANLNCAAGTTQSPINLGTSTASILSPPPKISIPNVDSAEFEHLGTTIEVHVNGTLMLEGLGDFSLTQFHFHTPSEHRIDEMYFPLEVHMVHEKVNSPGTFAVLALLFELSPNTTTPLLTSVTENLSDLRTGGTGSATTTGPLDFKPLISHLTTTPLFTYTGSLTTPPCTEGLTFMVTQEPLPIDVETFNKLKETLRFNSRYTQNEAAEGSNILQVGCNSAILAAEKRVAEGVRNGTVKEEVGTEKGQRVLKCLMGACE